MGTTTELASAEEHVTIARHSPSRENDHGLSERPKDELPQRRRILVVTVAVLDRRSAARSRRRDHRVLSAETRTKSRSAPPKSSRIEMTWPRTAPNAPAPPAQTRRRARDSGRAGARRTYFLGRYRVVDEIGIGGMASVHLARMDGPGGFQKWVAIKRIHPHLVEDESFVQMFLDEARVAARISHPNVATVFDLGKHDDTYWIAMEYLHGEPLREVMRRTEELGTRDAAGDRVPRHRRRRRRSARRARAARQERREARPRPPRRHAAQPVRHLRRRHQGRRLRHREVQLAHGQHARRHAQGQARVHVARSRCTARASIAAPTSSRSASCSGSSRPASASSAWRAISTRSRRCRSATSRGRRRSSAATRSSSRRS